MRIPAIFATCVLLIGCFNQNKPYSNLEPTNFLCKLEEEEQPQILDVRTPAEYAAGHLNGALNIDFYDESFSTQIKSLDKQKPVFIYCLSGGRSLKAAKILLKEGFEVIELNGGLKSWINASFPVEYGAIEASQQNVSRADFIQTLHHDTTYLLYFSADWCLPCRKLKPSIIKLDSLMGEKIILKQIPFDHHLLLANDFEVKAVPTIIILKNDQVLWQHEGKIEQEKLFEMMSLLVKNS